MALRSMLESCGYEVTVEATLAGARARRGEREFGAFLVDRWLPDGDGLDFVRDLRSAGDDTPAVIITSMTELEHRLDGLRGGADDYMSKPFSVEELRLRLERLTKRRGEPKPVVSGPLRMDSVAHRVWVRDQEVVLTATEFALLELLTGQSGRVFRMAEILEQVWGLRHDPGTNRVAVYVRHLRSKIGPGLIHSVRGVGYVFDPNR